MNNFQGRICAQNVCGQRSQTGIFHQNILKSNAHAQDILEHKRSANNCKFSEKLGQETQEGSLLQRCTAASVEIYSPEDEADLHEFMNSRSLGFHRKDLQIHMMVFTLAEEPVPLGRYFHLNVAGRIRHCFYTNTIVQNLVLAISKQQRCGQLKNVLFSPHQMKAFVICCGISHCSFC